MNIKIAFLLTILAGSATILGILPIFFPIKKKEKIINLSLSFASGVMFSASFFDLIPEAFLYFFKQNMPIPSVLYVFIFFSIGILFSTFLNKHLEYQDNNLYKVGITSFLAIIIHNIPEGIITFLTASIDMRLGIRLALAILLHNIPEGISIAVPIYYSTKKKRQACFYTFLASISEPFGALIAFFFLKNIMNNFVIGIILSLIAGVMINISLYELLPEAFQYHDKKLTIKSTIFGILFMYFSILLLR